MLYVCCGRQQRQFWAHWRYARLLVLPQAAPVASLWLPDLAKLRGGPPPLVCRPNFRAGSVQPRPRRRRALLGNGAAHAGSLRCVVTAARWVNFDPAPRLSFALALAPPGTPRRCANWTEPKAPRISTDDVLCRNPRGRQPGRSDHDTGLGRYFYGGHQHSGWSRA